MSELTTDIKGTPYCFYSDKSIELDELATRVASMRSSGRLSPDVLCRLRKYFRIKNIYNSNAIEGNVLDVGETRQVVEYGLTITGKPLKDQAEAKNLSHALDLLEEMASGKGTPIKEVDIRQLHKLVLKGVDDDNAGRYRSIQVEISGSEYSPPGPESVPSQMEELSYWLQSASDPNMRDPDINPIVAAAVAHSWLVAIHPFIDGNGRVARLLMNLILMRHGFPIAVITREDRMRYYDALEEAQSSDMTSFVTLLCECLQESLEEYEDAASEQREQQEWAAQLGKRFSAPERTRATNRYEVWKSAMELMRSYFRQTATLLNDSIDFGCVYFRDFGMLETEKYLALLRGQSAKKTWFFRIDFRRGDRTARYLFFFGFASYNFCGPCKVTVHISREEPEGSFHYEKLDDISAPNAPSLREIGYDQDGEKFVARYQNDQMMESKIETIGQRLIEDIVQKHFAS